MVVTNILKAKHLSELMKKSTVYQVWLGREGLKLINTFTSEEKSARLQKDYFLY